MFVRPGEGTNMTTQAFFDNSDSDFSILFQQLIDIMVDYEHFSREKLVDLLCTVARRFRLSKVVTEFYRNETEEKDGKGEILCDFDEGPADIVVLRKQLIARSGAVVRATAYCKKGEKPLAEEELWHVDLCLRSIMSFVSRNRLQTAIEVLAYHDNNGYPNFPYYFRHLEKMNREGGFVGFTAMMYNLRQFSIVNRDIGFEAGDRVMRSHFETVKALIGENGTLARIGGDNFVAIFPNEMLEKIITVLEGMEIVYDEATKSTVNISACAGVFIIPSDFTFDRPGSIVEMIMPACQAAKNESNGSIVYASRKNREDKENISRVRRYFETALETGEFHAYYQPKVDVMTGRIVGAEALCRWIRDGKVVPPMEFIPILEQNSDICKLDFYMLELVCKDIARWLSEGRKVVRISVNLSRKHLMDMDILGRVVSIIERYKVPFEYIELELTETTTEGDYQKLKKLVEGLRRIGIHTSIDDFGVGYSSLNIIRELPWNVMKIDRSLLPFGVTDKKDLSTLLYKHITAMARDMGLECLTEGVETAEQVQVLRDNFCSYAQGYYYDRPLPAPEFEQRMSIGGYNDH